jgi:tRNA-2-methylthio-N6-dimethylallyladenosine synthase
MAAHANVCRHLHLALQSGSDRVLQAMGRGYDRARFLALVDAARRALPGVNLTTDVIVGFPGETRGEFEETLSLVRLVRFGSIFAAKYSPRPGTRAAALADDVPAEEKEARLAAVLDAQRQIAAEENERLVGSSVIVLVEGATRDGRVYGRADDHRTVVVTGRADVGDLVTVRVETATAAALSGSVERPA